MADAKTTAKKGMSSTTMWIVGLVALVVIVGGVNLMYMKKIKKLEAEKAAAQRAANSNTGSMGGNNTPVISDATNPASGGKEPVSLDSTK